MNVTHTKESLVAFEDDLSQCFLDRKIRAPCHLSGGNEEQLIGIFRERIDPDDWLCCTWRSHYACLLKGVPPLQVKQAVLDGRSISLCFPEYRIVSSALVGGMAPIACGLALAIKRKGEASRRKVVCFLGDMGAETGIAYEAIKYAVNHALPAVWIVEDNGLSVSTDTMLAWGALTTLGHESIIRYNYLPTRPHVGTGKWVTF